MNCISTPSTIKFQYKKNCWIGFIQCASTVMFLRHLNAAIFSCYHQKPLAPQHQFLCFINSIESLQQQSIDTPSDLNAHTHTQHKPNARNSNKRIEHATFTPHCFLAPIMWITLETSFLCRYRFAGEKSRPHHAHYISVTKFINVEKCLDAASFSHWPVNSSAGEVEGTSYVG